VDFYAVYVKKSGERFTDKAATYVSEPRVTLRGEYGDKIRVRVRAWGGSGRSVISSRHSPASAKVRFVNPNQSTSSLPRVKWWQR
jgi:hypothetical protein